MMHRTTSRTLAALVLTLAVAACTGDDDAATGGISNAPGTAGANGATATGGAAGAQGTGGQARQPGASASARFTDREGRDVGEVTLEEGAEGVFIHGRITGLSGPAHGFHFHQVGACEPPFDSAGGHFNPGGRQHGLANPNGPHAGDMPNLFPVNGVATIEAFAPLATLGAGPNSLLDADGTAIVVHAGRDDQRTDPSGDSGDRIACAVLRR
jgi:superoxide dismutase, Cu-Zn family